MRLCVPQPRAVSFELHQDDFTVPVLPGVSFCATYRVFGKVTEAGDGDAVTPDGMPTVELDSELVDLSVQIQEPVSGDWNPAAERAVRDCFTLRNERR